jgi:nondiscriminating glutamyl-tRNA synthetase
MGNDIRVRFAPSPTGPLHVGNARTALFNFLFARQKGGAFILRLEDTDLERSNAEAEKAILRDLRWLGFDWDEGPDQPGDRGPYRQSERVEVYRRYAQEFLAKGNAYRCYCTAEELEEKRRRLLAKGIPPRYDGRCRHLTAEEEHSFSAAGRSPSLRFKVKARTVEFQDLVKGRVSFDGQKLGDFIMLRSDGGAPYNFAVVVDDGLMGITHVIRGEDHLTNTPRQLLLYEALGFSPPQFAHLPLILGPDRTPLSKRHGATAVAHFREEGYLPGALANYLALLGWSGEGAREIYSVGELIKNFSLQRVSRSAAIFNYEKLNWVNRNHLKSLAGEEKLELARPFLQKKCLPLDQLENSWWKAALEVVWEEVDNLSQLADHVSIFCDGGWKMEADAESLLRKEESRKILQALGEELLTIPQLDAGHYQRIVSTLAQRHHLSGRGLYMPLRAALTGKSRGPELEKIFVLLGKEKVLQRVELALRTAEAERSQQGES